MKTTKNYLQLALVIVCISLIIRYFISHASELQKISNLTIYHILILLFTILCIHLIACYKFFLILRGSQLNKITYFEWLKTFTISRFVNFHVTQGGNVYRALILKKNYDFSYTNSIGMFTFYAWIEIIFIFLISCVVIALINRNLLVGNINILTSLIVMLLLFVTAPFLGKVFLKRLDFRFQRLNWLRHKFIELSDYILNNVQNYSIVMRFFFLSLISFIFYVWAIYNSFDALGITLQLDEITLFTILILLSSVILITPGNIGIMELLYGVLAGALGWTLGDGILACSILRILGYLLIAGLTLFWNRSLLGIEKTADP